MTEFPPPVQVRTSKNGIALQRSGYGGVEVFLLTEVPHKGRLYSGFEFSFVTEYRDVTDKLVKAALIAPNQVAFQMPSMNTQFMLDYEEVWNQVINTPIPVANANPHIAPKYHHLYCQRAAQAHMITFNKLRDSPHLKVRIVVLTFPKNMVLSNDKYSPSSKNGLMQQEPTPMSSTVTTASQKVFPLKSIRNVWRVLVEDDDAPKINHLASSEDDNAAERMEAMMNQLGIK